MYSSLSFLLHIYDTMLWTTLGEDSNFTVMEAMGMHPGLAGWLNWRHIKALLLPVYICEAIDKQVLRVLKVLESALKSI